MPYNNFMKSFMLGAIDFKSPSAKSQMQFRANILDDEGGFGIYMDPITVSDPAVYSPMDTVGFNYLYLIAFSCPSASGYTYLNMTTNLCEFCTIPGCVYCNTLLMCSSCDG